MSHTVLPTNNSVPIENVVVAESGDDSDDGWDYIKVNKDKEVAAAAASADIEQQQQQQQQQQEQHHLDLEPQLESHQHENVHKIELQSGSEQQQEPEHDQFESQETRHFEIGGSDEAYTKQQEQQFVDDDTAVTSPTPPTASLGEIELIQHPEESHAVAQAYAEPEEACSELLDAKKDQNIRESSESDLERVERSSSVVAEHDSDLGADQDLEEMDSSALNPEAAEFVPVSPQRTMSSPLGNGINPLNRHDLFDDEIVSQSPRKGTVVDMDNIEIPTDHDFEDGASKCASNLYPEYKIEINASFTGTPANVQLNFESNIETNNTQRPESSSSQCSYQEMNLKEAMHGDEKQELAAEVMDTDYIGNMNGANGVEGAHQIDDYSEARLCEDDPMKMSFYAGDGTKMGAFENNNPFKEPEVDMNSVQPLPDDVMFEDDNKENGMADEQEQHQQQQQQQQHFEQTETLIEHHYEQPSAAHEYDNVEHEELAKESASESEKLSYKNDVYDHDDNAYESHSTITEVVQQMATEMTSVLNEIPQNQEPGFPKNVNEVVYVPDEYPPKQEMLHENNEIPSDVINQSNWSVNANEFKPINQMSDFGFENNVQMSIPNEVEHFNQPSNEQLFLQVEQQQEQPQQLHFDEPAVEKETPPMVTNVFEAGSPVEPVPVTYTAPVERNKEDEKVSNEVNAAAATLGLATAAVATAAAVKSAKSPTKSASSTSTTKKTNLTGSTAGAKKPLSATSKVASKPTTDVKPKTATGLSKVAAARAAAPRVTAAAPKSSSTTSSTTTTRKLLSNGVSSTTKKTFISTVATTSCGSSRPTTAPSKTLTSRPVSSTTATKTTKSSTVSKTTAAPRVPLSQRSVAPKPATTASKLSATKPAVSSSIGSRIKSAPAPSTIRSTTLTKPKTTTSTDKPLTSTGTCAASKLSPAKTVSSTTTTTIKKSPISKTTTTTTTTTSSATTKKLSPIKRPATTLTRTTPSKTTNGVASKTTKTVIANETAVQKLNGHAENGNADKNAIIDLSTD